MSEKKWNIHWEEGEPIERIMEQLKILEDMGATHISFSAYSSYGVPEISIVAENLND